jgi:hypothetical protein
MICYLKVLFKRMSTLEATVLFTAKVGGSWWMCVYRAFNAVAIKNKYLLPHIVELFDLLIVSKVF